MDSAIKLASLLFAFMTAEGHAQSPVVIVVVGAGGAAEYSQKFSEWAERWKNAAITAEAQLIVIGQGEQHDDREQFRTALQHPFHPESELWLVLIGHGTFDRREAKFNLRGPDVSASDLKQWLSGVQVPTAVINLSASSAPFLLALAGPRRVVVTATKSGEEQNFARFGDYFSQAIGNLVADLDKDEQVSLWEAYLFASRRIKEFYDTNGRLQTEHALLDDNGDGQGTRAEAFEGLTAIQSAAESNTQLDGTIANRWHLVRSPRDARLTASDRQTRDRLLQKIGQLKMRKVQMEENAYYFELEALLIPLAKLSEHPTSVPSPNDR